MSAVELLKKVRALPARDRRKFVLAVLALDAQTLAKRENKSQRVKWPDVEARAKRIFGDRMLPNLVQLERQEAPF